MHRIFSSHTQKQYYDIVVWDGLSPIGKRSFLKPKSIGKRSIYGGDFIGKRSFLKSKSIGKRSFCLFNLLRMCIFAADIKL